MNFKEDMSFAKLKGHDYKVTEFQYYEIMHHMDPEFQWIIYETITKFIKNANSDTYRLYSLFLEVANTINSIIVEREKAENKPNYRDIADKMFDAYSSFQGYKGANGYEIVDTFLIYGIKSAIINVRYFNNVNRQYN